MKTQYYTAATLDGFIADERHSLDWLFQFGDGEPDGYADFIREVGALTMGAHTYEWLLKNHVHSDPNKPAAWPYDQPAWVFTTRSLPTVDGVDIRFVRGDVRPVHQEMAETANGRNVWVVGGGELAGQFFDAGLLDELIVTIAPVTLGAGAPLLPRAITRPPLRLTSARKVGGAFVEVRYDVQRGLD